MAKRKKASKSQWKGVKDCRNSSSRKYSFPVSCIPKCNRLEQNFDA